MARQLQPGDGGDGDGLDLTPLEDLEHLNLSSSQEESDDDVEKPDDDEDSQSHPWKNDTANSTSPCKRSLNFCSPNKPKLNPARKVHVTTRSLSKRSRSSPMKASPKSQTKKKKTKTNGKRGWNDEENKALVEFCTLPSQYDQASSDKWASMSNEHPYWREAAEHVANKTGFPIRSGGAMRTRVTKKIGTNFTKESAEKAYDLDDLLDNQPASLSSTELQRRRVSISTRSRTAPKSTQTAGFNPEAHTTDSMLEHLKSMQLTSAEHVEVVKKYMTDLDDDTLQSIANNVFLELATRKGVDSNPADFAEISTKAMVRLQEAGKPNVVHHFSKIIAEDRPGTSQPLIPLDRMPFGLIEYQIEFFASTNSSQVKTPADYRHWLLMMMSELGQRFFRLFRGPMWSGFEAWDDEMRDPLHARVNVASIAYGTLCKDMAESHFTTTPEIQVEALKQLKEANPDGKFWIKLDGTDIKPALQESKRQEWNGDVDLRDGELQKMKIEYNRRRKMATSSPTDKIKEDIAKDKEFLQKLLKETVEEYSSKLKKPGTSQERLKEFNWQIVETSNLLQQCEQLREVYANTTDHAKLKRLHKGKEEDHLTYLRHLFTKKRTAATHVLVLMVSDELRKNKPYSLPVQYIPYKSLTDEQCRGFVNNLKRKMAEFGLTCVGTVTDGEFSTLRAKGTSRPVHVAEVISKIKNQVSKTGKKTLVNMIQRNEADDVQPSDIPESIIDKVATLQAEGRSLKEAVATVRNDLAPPGHSISTWKPHCPESLHESIRTVLAVSMYRKQLAAYHADGVDFLHHLYVPEDDQITGTKDDHREDHNHLLKRIAMHTREGKNGEIDVSRFDEAMRSPDTDLTQVALVGTRKQSVKDAELLLSHSVAKFFAKKGYTAEHKYVENLANWHEATDGRGMSQTQRAAANNTMLEYIMKDWTPWWSSESTLADIDFNRPLDTILGFSRPSFIGITTNIESQELRRSSGEEPEHPRSSTTDDCECLFSLSHRKAHGLNVTVKEWKYNWRKLIWEFTNRLDGDLPFWYWTLNERFHIQEDWFDQPSDDNIPRLHLVKHRSREDSSIMAAGRTHLPVKKRRTIRQEHFLVQGSSLPSVPEEYEDHIQRLLAESTYDAEVIASDANE